VLRKALEALERAFESHKDGAILKAIREAVQACRETAPDQIERLKQHISVRSALADVSVEKVEAAMGGASRQDAYFSRLFARGMEEIGDPESIAWPARRGMSSGNRRCAKDGSRRTARKPPRSISIWRACCESYACELLVDLQKPPPENRKSVEDLYFLYPEKLYERACALDPHFESFSQWMDWAKRDRPGRPRKWPKRGTRSARWISSRFSS
jgi:hypothetical protein